MLAVRDFYKPHNKVVFKQKKHHYTGARLKIREGHELLFMVGEIGMEGKCIKNLTRIHLFQQTRK